MTKHQDNIVTLFASPELKQATPLSQSRGALTFAINTCIQHVSSNNPDTSGGNFKGIPTVITRLVIGCRRKVVVFTWQDGEVTTPKVRNLVFSGYLTFVFIIFFRSLC